MKQRKRMNIIVETGANINYRNYPEKHSNK